MVKNEDQPKIGSLYFESKVFFLLLILGINSKIMESFFYEWKIY